MPRKIVPSAALVVLAALVATLGASAAFPGKNGKIVFGSQQAGEDEIWVMDSDGTDRRNLTRHDGAKISDIDPRWSPDGRKIVYASDPTGSMQIWVMNANGSGAQPLTNLPGRNRFPAFTGDGKHIVFQSVVDGNFEIYRMKTDGTEITNLTNDPGVDWAPATSAKGKKIVFTRERDGNGNLHVWSPDTPLVQVTSTAGYDYFANWSPKGNDLVFIRYLDGEDEVYTAHADGTNERRLTNTPGITEYFPAFSPDGKKITFTRCGPPRPAAAPNPVCSVHIMNVDGTGDTDLVYPTPPTQLPFTDDFDDNVRNTDYWSLIHDGTGGTVAERRGRVEFTLAADAAPSSGPFPAIRVSYDFKCILNADFDAQVDYKLLDWPAANGAVVQLQSFYADANVTRQSHAWGESYEAWVAPSAFNAVVTPHESGTLRLTRDGPVFTAYYLKHGGWVPIVEAEGSTGQALLVIGLASYDSFAHQKVRVAFDNFRVDADDVDCSSNRPDLHPDWQPLGK
jgi:TolB protein